MRYKYVNCVLFCLAILMLTLVSGCEKETVSIRSYNSPVVVHYIDVGQGDSELIQVDGKNILIDAGPEDNADNLLRYLKGAGVKIIDLLVATHPHEDHIGGMAKIIRAFSIKKMYAPKKVSNTEAFANMVSALRSKNMKINIALVTDKEKVMLQGKNYMLKMLSPMHQDYEEINNYSVVCKLKYMNTSFLFTGDAQNLVEQELLENNSDIKADVLKVGHHGSKYSTSIEFLKRVAPKIAVISCGRNNDYGHPAEETIARLEQCGIKTCRTDISGNIIIVSNGQEVRQVSP